MKGAWLVLGGWGALLVAFAAVQIAFSPEAAELALLGGSGAIVVLGGIAALIAERRRNPRRATADDLTRWSSVATVALAVGVCLFVLGWEVGAWCMAIGVRLMMALEQGDEERLGEIVMTYLGASLTVQDPELVVRVHCMLVFVFSIMGVRELATHFLGLVDQGGGREPAAGAYRWCFNP